MTNSQTHQSMAADEVFGRRVAARLSASTNDLPYDITERLRASRVRAVAQRKVSVAVTAPVLVTNGNGTLAMGDEGLNWWSRLASALPIMALLVGMVVINVVQDESRARELAEVDAALLTDDLPPAAYADPGFLQFLKSAEER